ncbi:MAG: hypothetical protein HRU19_29400 [Pseudobacteriovorax sp.]|nr:hypothetical protein [Pseudobacteriovorax sp.]
METEDQFDEEIRAALADLAKSFFSQRGDIKSAAEKLGKKRAAVEKMKKFGTGSVTSWARLIALNFDIERTDLLRIIRDLNNQSSKDESDLDSLYHTVKQMYEHQELAGWLKLMRDKGRIEKDLGVEIKIHDKKK